MTDPLTWLLNRAGSPDPVVTADGLDEDAVAAIPGLVDLGLMAPAAPATAVVCDGCDADHVGEVVRITTPGLPIRWFVACPESGRVAVDPDRLRQWVVVTDTLARQVANCVGSTGGVAERYTGRVWKLGPFAAGGRAWVGWLAVGLDRPDGAELVDAAPELLAGNAVVFVPTMAPPASVWGNGSGPTVVPLIDVLRLARGGLAVDRAFLNAHLTAPGEPIAMPVPAPVPPGTTWDDITIELGERNLHVQTSDRTFVVDYVEARLAARRTGKPNRSRGLLALLARRGGELGTGDRLTTKSDALKQQFAGLRDRLRRLTGLDDDPFHPIRRGGDYRTRFRVVSAVGPVFVAAVSDWDAVALSEIRAEVVEVEIEAVTTGVVVDRGQGIASTEATVRKNVFAVGDLGLSASVGAALVAVLRADGSEPRPLTGRWLNSLPGSPVCSGPMICRLLFRSGRGPPGSRPRRSYRCQIGNRLPTGFGPVGPHSTDSESFFRREPPGFPGGSSFPGRVFSVFGNRLPEGGKRPSPAGTLPRLPGAGTRIPEKPIAFGQPNPVESGGRVRTTADGGSDNLRKGSTWEDSAAPGGTGTGGNRRSRTAGF